MSMRRRTFTWHVIALALLGSGGIVAALVLHPHLAGNADRKYEQVANTCDLLPEEVLTAVEPSVVQREDLASKMPYGTGFAHDAFSRSRSSQVHSQACVWTTPDDDWKGIIWARDQVRVFYRAADAERLYRELRRTEPHTGIEGMGQKAFVKTETLSMANGIKVDILQDSITRLVILDDNALVTIAVGQQQPLGVPLGNDTYEGKTDLEVDHRLSPLQVRELLNEQASAVLDRLREEGR